VPYCEHGKVSGSKSSYTEGYTPKLYAMLMNREDPSRKDPSLYCSRDALAQAFITCSFSCHEAKQMVSRDKVFRGECGSTKANSIRMGGGNNFNKYTQLNRGLNKRIELNLD
jgi:hypothetical protein